MPYAITAFLLPAKLLFWDSFHRIFFPEHELYQQDDCVLSTGTLTSMTNLFLLRVKLKKKKSVAWNISAVKWSFIQFKIVFLYKLLRQAVAVQPFPHPKGTSQSPSLFVAMFLPHESLSWTISMGILASTAGQCSTLKCTENKQVC